MTGLADVDGFQISIHACVWPCFLPLSVLKRGPLRLARLRTPDMYITEM